VKTPTTAERSLRHAVSSATCISIEIAAGETLLRSREIIPHKTNQTSSLQTSDISHHTSLLPVVVGENTNNGGKGLSATQCPPQLAFQLKSLPERHC